MGSSKEEYSPVHQPSTKKKYGKSAVIACITTFLLGFAFFSYGNPQQHTALNDSGSIHSAHDGGAVELAPVSQSRAPIVLEEDLKSVIREYLSIANDVLDGVVEKARLEDGRKVNHITKRGLIDGLVSSLGSQAATAVTDGMTTAMTNVLAEMGTAMTKSASNSNMSTAMGSFLDTITNALIGSSGALGAGLAQGTVKGLALSTKASAPAAAPATGLNGIVESLGGNLTASLFSVVNISSLTGGLGDIDYASVGKSLAQGLGSGAQVSLFTGAVSAAAASANTSAFNTTGTNGIAGNFGNGLATSFLGGLDLQKTLMMAVGGSMVDVNGLSLALSQGLGSGALMGLSQDQALTAMPNSKAMFNTTGANGVAGNFGQGLSQSFIGGVNVSDLLSKATAGAGTVDLGAASLALSQGLGTGALQGLFPGMQSAAVATPAFNTTGTNGIAGNFGQGISSSFLGGLNVSDLASKATAGLGGMSVDFNGVALALSQGLGSGAADGLFPDSAKTTAMAAAGPAFNTTGTNGIAGNFGLGLSKSFLGGLNVSMLTSKLVGNASLSGTVMMLAPAAGGFGAGLGEGVAVGLGLQPDSGVPSTDMSAAGVARSFAKGLTESFLQNGTISKLTSSLAPAGASSAGSAGGLGALGGLAGGIAVSNVAQGFAMGLIDGAGASLTDAGGLGAVLGPGGTTDTMTSFMSLPPSGFNDSVGGAAEGFGRGLGGEGVKVVLRYLGKAPAAVSPPPAASAAPVTADTPATPATLPAADMSGMEMPGMDMSGSQMSVISKRDTDLAIRGEVIPRALNITGALGALNFTMIDMLVQTSINALTCNGIAGLVLVVFGLSSSGTLPSLSGASTSNITGLLASLPDSVKNANLAFTSSGNNYQLNLGASSLTDIVKVNGNNLTGLAAALVIHIILAILGFLTILPLILLLNQMQSVSVQMRSSSRMARTDKWQLYLGIVLVLFSLIILITGVVAAGNAKPFRSAHEILGLILFLQSLVAAPLAFFRKKSPQMALANRISVALLIIISLIVTFTGFQDLSELAVCVLQIVPFAGAMAIGWLLTVPVFFAVGVYVMRSFIVKIGASAGGEDSMTSKLLSDVSDNPARGFEKMEDEKRPRVEISAPIGDEKQQGALRTISRFE